jgi:hypothetical protein
MEDKTVAHFVLIWMVLPFVLLIISCLIMRWCYLHCVLCVNLFCYVQKINNQGNI